MSTFNSLVFDGVNSLDHGIYITGESVYNAPERDVESLEIAGRNGDYLLDKGRWKNIDVTYTAGAFGADQSEFATKIRQFRNLLASRYGYHRLTDTYNPNEYRLGVFKNAVEVEADSYKRAGEFELIFNCKPQRYLTSGETEMTISPSGLNIINPTLFASSPLLEVTGYGTIEMATVIDGDHPELKDVYTIEIENGDIGTIIVKNSSWTDGGAYLLPLGDYSGMYNPTDIITISLSSVGVHLYAPSATSTWFFSMSTASTFVTEAGSGSPSVTPTVTDWARDGIDWGMNASIPNISFPANASFGRVTVGRITATIPLVDSSANTATMTLTTDIEVAYTQNTLIQIDLTVTKTSAVDVSAIQIAGMGGHDGGKYIRMRYTKIESTASKLGSPTYIDCDLGEAYMIRDGKYVGLNSFIDLGSDLPTLAPGKNAIFYDNTITQLKIVPRWWQI